MNITKQDKGLTSVLTVNVTAADYQAGVENALKDYRKKAKFDGFRPGTVPMSLVKKMYGKYVLVDEVNKVISDSLQKYIRENNIQVLGEPLPSTDQSEINWETDTDFVFNFDIAIAPEVNLNLDKKTKADYFVIKASDEMVQNQLESYKARFGKQESVDVVGEDDMLYGKLTQVTNENPHVKDGASILLSKIAVQSETDLFINAKKGDLVTFNPKKALENEVEIAAMLSVNKDQTDLLEADYAYEITDILRFTKSEVNQDLYDKIFGEGVVSTETEMVERIKSDFENNLRFNSDYKFFYDFRKKLIQDTAIEFPEEFLKRWLLESNRDNEKITPEVIEAEFSYFLEDLKWQIITGKIIKENNLQVNDEDVKNGAKEYTRMQFAQFGLMNPSDEDLAKWSVEILKNKEEANKIIESEIQKKLTNYFKENISLKEIETSLEDFNKMLEQK